MEIPYVVTPRRDTGLYNGKVGIWLFLASEVMLFGALFSSYILLRVNALDINWPHGLLNIPIGTFNTFVLITSSVTVVMAWASLKMGKFSSFRTYMIITLLCALGFLGIKSLEYSDKFTHYEIWFKDGTRQTGHIYHEGKKAWFWTHHTLAGRAAVKDDKGKEIKPSLPAIAEFEFHPDPHHYAEKAIAAASGNTNAPAAHDHKHEHKHEAVKVKSKDVQVLSAFVPRHSTYFAIYFLITFLHGLHVLGGAIVMAYLTFCCVPMWKAAPGQLTNRIECAGLFWHFVDLVWIFLFPVLYLL